MEADKTFFSAAIVEWNEMINIKIALNRQSLVGVLYAYHKSETCF